METLETPCVEAGLVLAQKWCAFRTRHGAFAVYAYVTLPVAGKVARGIVCLEI